MKVSIEKSNRTLQAPRAPSTSTDQVRSNPSTQSYLNPALLAAYPLSSSPFHTTQHIVDQPLISDSRS